jgi:beta-glucosidase
MSCQCTYDHLGEAIERGLITEADIDRSLARTLATRFKLGMFDPQEMVPYSDTPMSVVGCEEHRKLAYETAVRSIVLLKNKNNILPIKESVRSLYIVGPNATNLDCLLGSYFGLGENMVTPLEGIAKRAPEGMRLEYKHGVLLAQDSANPFDWSVSAAAEADVTVAFMGLAPLLEGEEGDALLSSKGGDRDKIEIPVQQVEYIKKLVIAGARIVLVLFSGSPIALGASSMSGIRVWKAAMPSRMFCSGMRHLPVSCPSPSPLPHHNCRTSMITAWTTVPIATPLKCHCILLGLASATQSLITAN